MTDLSTDCLPEVAGALRDFDGEHWCLDGRALMEPNPARVVTEESSSCWPLRRLTCHLRMKEQPLRGALFA